MAVLVLSVVPRRQTKGNRAFCSLFANLESTTKRKKKEKNKKEEKKPFSIVSLEFLSCVLGSGKSEDVERQREKYLPLLKKKSPKKTHTHTQKKNFFLF